MPPTALVNFNEEPRYVVDAPDVVPKFWSTLDKIDNPVKRSFFAVLLLAGARQGDIKGLRWRNVYRAVAKSLHVDDVHLKLLVNHKLTDVTHGYAGQRSILLETLIAEQEQISRHLM